MKPRYRLDQHLNVIPLQEQHWDNNERHCALCHGVLTAVRIEELYMIWKCIRCGEESASMSGHRQVYCDVCKQPIPPENVFGSQYYCPHCHETGAV